MYYKKGMMMIMKMMKILAVMKIKLDELRLIRKRQSQSLAIMYILFGLMI